MKTSEMIAVLQKRLERHGDLPTIVECESRSLTIDYPSNIYATKDGWLTIDVDGCVWKRESAVDPWEGEGE